MDVKNVKDRIKVDNSSYVERFQFVLSVNSNIICQRYFKIAGFNKECLNSEDLLFALRECVNMIKNDLSLKSGSYVYWTTTGPMKMNGFVDKSETDYLIQSEVENNYVDERLAPWEVTYKFAFIVDNNTVFEEIWDGTDYPKFVRNGVDLTNSDALYRDKDASELPFGLALVRHLTYGKKDLVYHIIQKICEAASYNEDEYEYTKSMNYGDVEYDCNVYNKKFANGWRKATKDKTANYFKTMYPSDKALEYADKYL